MSTHGAGAPSAAPTLPGGGLPIGEGWPVGEGIGTGNQWRLTISRVFCVLTVCHCPNRLLRRAAFIHIAKFVLVQILMSLCFITSYTTCHVFIIGEDDFEQAVYLTSHLLY